MLPLPILSWFALALIGCFICYQDISQRTIANQLVLLVLLITFSLSVYQHSYINLLYSGALLLSGLILWRYNIMGGGDIKLLVAFSLAIKPEFLLLTLVIITVFGGILALAYYLFGLLTDLEKVKARGIPYGFPICLGSLFGIAASL